MHTAADVSLVLQQKSVTDIVIPSKLTGILASGRPVIAGANPGSEVYNILKDHGFGIIVKPEDSKQMSEAVIALYKNRSLAEQNSEKRF